MILTRYDGILIIVLLAVSLLGLGIARYKMRGSDTVLVQVNGKEVIIAPLAEDRRFSVDGPLGSTDIEVKDKRVRVVDSPCKRKMCVQTGWIYKSYQTIICAPNRVVIYLMGGNKDDKLDGVTG